MRVRIVSVAAAATVIVLAFAASAQAAGFKTGSVAYTAQNNCFPAGIIPSYTQPVQGTEPKVGEVTYLSVRVVFILPSSFNCAADFFRVLVTVPSGVQASGGAPICRRFYTSQGTDYYDSRIASNCPASISIDSTTHQFGLNPKSSGFVHPEKSAAAGTWWFFGYDSLGNLKTYTDVVLQVPVKATRTMTNQPVSYYVCTVGTSCATATVNMTINAAPPPPPDTTPPAKPGPLTGVPSGLNRSRAATIAFGLGETGGTVHCRLDSGSWRACTSVSGRSGLFSLTALADGAHTVSVRHTDASGNQSPIATTPAWRVDATAPSLGLAVSGATRLGKIVTLQARATDPSGIRRVTIKVGSATTKVQSTLRVRLPRTGSRLRVIVTATDMAGNTRTLAKYLTLRA